MSDIQPNWFKMVINPYYQISVYGTDPFCPSYNENIGGARVDAKTGEFSGGMG